jgi:hypothetical protein
MHDIGFLYVIGDGDRVKIGKSKTPEKRVKSIISISGIKNPKIFISNECSSHSKKELECHKRYSKAAIKGEWFFVCFDDAVSTVIEISDCENLTEKKEQQKDYDSATLKNISNLTKKIMRKPKFERYCTEESFNTMFKDTLELINICEDSSLIDRLQDVNGDLVLLLMVRCEAMEDVISQFSDQAKSFLKMCS